MDNGIFDLFLLDPNHHGKENQPLPDTFYNPTEYQSIWINSEAKSE